MLIFTRIVFILYVLIVLGLSLYPQPEKIIGDINDKIQHMIAFAIYVFLFYFSFPKASKLISFISGVFLGVLIEVLQRFVPNRFSSFLDIVADIAGLTVGIVGIYLFYKLKNKY